MSALQLGYPNWPDPAQIPIIRRGGAQFYSTPDGAFPRVTNILKILGMSTNALVAWSAREERKAVLQACAEVYAAGFLGGPAEFAAAVDARIGYAKQHQKIVAEAAEIGTAAHQRVQYQMKHEMGQALGPEPVLEDRAQWAYMAFQDWWKDSGLKVIRSEQPVWDTELGYAGSLDIVVECPKRGPGVIDLKTSKYVYEEHHLQVAAYCHAARNWSEIKWAQIVRLPKKMDDPEFEVVELGRLHERSLTEEQLMAAFRGALQAWNVLVGRES